MMPTDENLHEELNHHARRRRIRAAMSSLRALERASAILAATASGGHLLSPTMKSERQQGFDAIDRVLDAIDRVFAQCA